ncbi:myosin-G heavy chain-like [Sitodiplosis mosellana]|uniref:myosin-G heavy chain-like n=1 Tax=Sitodiplosis mosellana TaxID=263140 RepID=UPI00244509B0|nr:myosin-G heavy chain-like [Sitodiplosis mosellana]
MHLTGGSSNNTFNPIAPTNNSSTNTCSSSIVNSKKQHSISTIKCDNNSFAQHVDSSKSISKNSLRLDITSKTCDALTANAAAAAANGGGGSGGVGVDEEKVEIMASPKCDATAMSPQTAQSTSSSSKKTVKRNFSMISFKSLDFNLRSICSSMKGKHGKDTNSSGSGKSTTVPTASSSKTSITTTTRTPYLKVEAVDNDVDEEHLLISFPQSPYSHRGSFDKTQSQHLTTVHSDYTRSQASSPFLSITTPPNIRRSSTSDIIDKKPPMPSTNVTPNESRRPSTSSLLRKARERKGSETKGAGALMSHNMGSRSLSHGGLSRGGGRMGRRTSMAF